MGAVGDLLSPKYDQRFREREQDFSGTHPTPFLDPNYENNGRSLMRLKPVILCH